MTIPRASPKTRWVGSVSPIPASFGTRPAAETPALRRGVAGDVFVFKVAGAAAEAGGDINEVERLARLANARTVSFGVAFRGCTLPGAREPLFTVPAGQMGVGLGIHGEPGISEEPIVSARALAEILVERLLRERPAAPGGPVAAASHRPRPPPNQEVLPA